MISTCVDQVAFYKEFLMARHKFEPSDFGIAMDKEQFVDQMVDDFAEAYRDGWTIDELCLHPREAARFCDDIRHRHAYFDLPDDIILRSIMQRRKNPSTT